MEFIKSLFKNANKNKEIDIEDLSLHDVKEVDVVALDNEFKRLEIFDNLLTSSLEKGN